MNKDDAAAHFLKKLLPEREDMKFLFVISCRLLGAIHLEASCPVMEASKESSRASKESSRDEVARWTEHSFKFVFEELSCHKYCSNSNLNSF